MRPGHREPAGPAGAEAKRVDSATGQGEAGVHREDAGAGRPDAGAGQAVDDAFLAESGGFLAESGGAGDERGDLDERPVAPRSRPVEAAERGGVEAVELPPQQLQVSAAEVDFMARLGRLLPTPRAAKRLVNVYPLGGGGGG